MKRSIVLIVLMVFSSMVICLNAQEGVNIEKRVLIYYFTGEGFVHDNIVASVEALEEICDSIDVESVKSNDPSVFERPYLMEFDAIIFANTNAEAFTNQMQRNNFQEFIRSGKGFVGIHSATTSEKDWPWYRSMVGGRFLRHPELQPFTIKVIDSLHISTKHLPLSWEWEDECYLMDYLNPDMNVLLAADLTTLTDDQLDEFPGKIFGDLFPLAWYHQYDGGRQWQTALGHKAEYYDIPVFRDHLRGGIMWALGMETYPIKHD